jgi:transcription elongation factor Elf1
MGVTYIVSKTLEVVIECDFCNKRTEAVLPYRHLVKSSGVHCPSCGWYYKASKKLLAAQREGYYPEGTERRAK